MVYATSDIEKSLWVKGYKLICGIDEVGRGCFAGPVVAGAVIFSQGGIIPEGLADSKLLSPKKREELSLKIKESCAGWSYGSSSVEEINVLGIGKATQLAFKRSIENLTLECDFVIIDAFFIDQYDRDKQMPIAGGDKLSVSIAAASIIAKVYRDNLMQKLHSEFPDYGFDIHKGYGTKKHQEAIKKYGLCKLHRTSFNLSKFI